MRNLNWLWPLVTCLLLGGCSAPINISLNDGSIPTPLASPPTAVFYSDEPLSCWNESKRDSNNSSSFSPFLVSRWGAYKSANDEDLYLLDSSTAKYKLLASWVSPYSVKEISPVSPDGKHFWYLVTDSNIKSEIIYIYDLETNTSQVVPFWTPLTTLDNDISWSPNGSCLVISNRSIGEALVAYDLEKKVFQRRAVQGVNFFSETIPSDDGKIWATNCYGKICFIDEKGKLLDYATINIPYDTETRLYHQYGFMRWAPNSHTLAFAYAKKHSRIIDTVMLVDIALESSTVVSEIIPIVLTVSDLRWSPKENLLLINGAETGPNGQTQILQIYDRVSGDMHPVNFPRSISIDWTGSKWTANGKEIIYIGEDKFYLLNITDNTIKEIAFPENTYSPKIFPIP